MDANQLCPALEACWLALAIGGSLLPSPPNLKISFQFFLIIFFLLLMHSVALVRYDGTTKQLRIFGADEGSIIGLADAALVAGRTPQVGSDSLPPSSLAYNRV
jgi:hypothetical protein